jgi:hypothetical protein
MTLTDRCKALLDRGTKPTAPEVLPLVQEYLARPDNAAGGSLHLVLEDLNLEDHFVRSCAEHAHEQGDADGEALAQVLLLCSRTQRHKLATARAARFVVPRAW